MSTKFKVGDKVRRINSDFVCDDEIIMRIGQIATVKSFDSHYEEAFTLKEYRIDCSKYPFNVSNFELANDVPSVEFLVEQINKCSEYKDLLDTYYKNSYEFSYDVDGILKTTKIEKLKFENFVTENGKGYLVQAIDHFLLVGAIYLNIGEFVPCFNHLLREGGSKGCGVHIMHAHKEGIKFCDKIVPWEDCSKIIQELDRIKTK